MNKVLLRNVKINDEFFDKLYVFQDDDGVVMLLPLLWSIHLSKTNSVYGWHTTRKSGNHGKGGSSATESLTKSDITENTIDNYICHFYKFLRYVNDIHKLKGISSVHYTHEINSKFLNHYLNEILVNDLNSEASLIAHQSAISAYFNFIFSLQIKDVVTTTIPRKTLQKIAERDIREKKISYISKDDRNALLRVCNSQRDRLILRMGYEVGLRAAENTGLLLGKHKAKLQTHKGLLDLFDELDIYPTKQSFEYKLNGKYCKLGKSRDIYFKRELLTDLRYYYQTERKWVVEKAKKNCDTLFVKTDVVGLGEPIGVGAASDIFTEARTKCPHMNSTLGYHDLRHTFGTELYHEELLDKSGNETRSESAALTVVQNRLGHASDLSTRRYIRMHIQMQAIEGV